MANPHRGEVELVVGENTFKLRLSINAIVEVERTLNMTIAQVSQQMSLMSVTVVRGLLWGALRQHHPKMTLNDVGDLIDEIGLTPVIGLLGEVMAITYPEPEGAANPR